MRRVGLSAVVLLGVLAFQLATPQPSYAIFDWLFGHHSNPCDPCAAPTTTYYRPLFSRPLFPRLGLFRRTAFYAPVAATSCSPCAVQYVQQTSYRAEVVQVPVTSYQPVVTTDPCTGCATTVMRPVVTYVQQVRYRPVITYRPVVANACCPTTTYYAPACCPTTTTSDCCTGTLPSTTSPEQPSLPSTQQSPTPTPTYQQPSQQDGKQETYRQPMDPKQPSKPEEQKPKLQPIPDKSSASGAPAPRLVFPDDRTAQAGTVRIHRAVASGSQVQPVLRPVKETAPAAQGFRWRPARRRVAQATP